MKDRAKALADLGAEIRRTREEKGLTLEDVTEVVKIRTNFLEDIENGNFDNFPSGVYIRGFVRSYLRFLGADELWSQYKPYLYSEDIVDTSDLVLGTLTPPTKGFKHNSRVWLIVLMVVAITGLSLYGLSLVKSDSENRTTVSVIEEKTGEKRQQGDLTGGESSVVHRIEEGSSGAGPVVEGTVSESSISGDELAFLPENNSSEMVLAKPEEQQDKEIEPAPEPVLVLTTTRDCWVRITGEDSTIYEGVIAGESSRQYILTERVTVTYGRPASINITFMGEELGNPGDGGAVERWFYAPDGSRGRING